MVFSVHATCSQSKEKKQDTAEKSANETFQQVIDEVWTQRGMKMKQKPVKNKSS